MDAAIGVLDAEANTITIAPIELTTARNLFLAVQKRAMHIGRNEAQYAPARIGLPNAPEALSLPSRMGVIAGMPPNTANRFHPRPSVTLPWWSSSSACSQPRS